MGVFFHQVNQENQVIEVETNISSSFLLNNVLTFEYFRIFDQPVFMSDREYDDDEQKAQKKGFNEVNMPLNSSFALAIIQSLLNNGANAFESIE